MPIYLIFVQSWNSGQMNCNILTVLKAYIWLLLVLCSGVTPGNALQTTIDVRDLKQALEDSRKMHWSLTCAPFSDLPHIYWPWTMENTVIFHDAATIKSRCIFRTLYIWQISIFQDIFSLLVLLMIPFRECTISN